MFQKQTMANPGSLVFSYTFILAVIASKCGPSLSHYVRSAKLKARPVGGSLTPQPTGCLPRTIRKIAGKLLNYPLLNSQTAIPYI